MSKSYICICILVDLCFFVLKGTSKVEIIHLDFPLNREVKWDGNAFKKMKNLRTLIIKKCHFSKAPIHLPNSLRVLEWWKYPSEELPSDFHAKELSIWKPTELLKASISSFLWSCIFKIIQLIIVTFFSFQKFICLRALFDCDQCMTQIHDVSDVPNLGGKDII